MGEQMILHSWRDGTGRSALKARESLHILCRSLAMIVFLFGVAASTVDAADSLATNTWTLFAGTRVYLDGVRAQPGTTIEAFDPDGVLCGRFIMAKPDTFGWLYVYGDDFTTEEDDGASEGDLIEFTVNGLPTDVVGETRWSSGTGVVSNRVVVSRRRFSDSRCG
jgi:hypothetical protein